MMKTSLVYGLVLVLLISCDPILLKVATQDQVQVYKNPPLGTVADPAFSLPSGDYSSDATLILTTTTPGASIHYSADGLTIPSTTVGNTYVGALTIPPNATTTFRAVGFLGGWSASKVVTGVYTSHQAGTIDTAFGTSGTGIGLAGSARSLGVQSNGQVVMTGYTAYDNSSNQTFPRMVMYKANADGSSIGPNYLRYRENQEAVSGLTNYYMLTSDGLALVVQSDDKVVVAGWEGTMNNPDKSQQTSTTHFWGVYRFQSDALTLDSKFSDFGAVDGSQATAVVLQPDGKIVAAGTSNGVLTLVRYLSNGSLDTTFGSGGVVATSFAVVPASLLFKSDGSFLAVGLSIGGVSEWTVAFTSAGSLNTGYGSSGMASNVLPDPTNVKSGLAAITAAALQTDGKVVFVGNPYSAATADHPFLVGRLTTAGGLDSSFGSGGYASGYGATKLPLSNPFPSGYNTVGSLQFDEPRAVVVTASGKILVAGTTKIMASDGVTVLGTQLDLARFTPNGSLDTSYNGVSGYNLRAGVGTKDEWNGLVIQTNGEVVAAGQGGRLLAGSVYDSLSFTRFW